jgi:hypothetical protein
MVPSTARSGSELRGSREISPSLGYPSRPDPSSQPVDLPGARAAPCRRTEQRAGRCACRCRCRSAVDGSAPRLAQARPAGPGCPLGASRGQQLERGSPVRSRRGRHRLMTVTNLTRRLSPAEGERRVGR